MALFCCLLMGLHANAYNKLSIPDVFVTQGGSIDVPVNLENEDQVVALQFTLTVPNGVTLNVNSSRLTDRCPDHSIHIVKKQGNDYLCLVFSNNNAAITGNSGAVINLAMSLPNQVNEGDLYPLIIKDAVASDAYMNNVLTESSSGSISCGTTPQAIYYLVGMEPFGTGWSPSSGVTMTRSTDGTYSYSGTINGSIWFVLADNLATGDDWDTFNYNYRIGPIGEDETVNAGVWTQTQRAYGSSGAYKFTGSGSEYVITFDPDNMVFKIDGDVEPPHPVETYTVAGSPSSVFGTEWDQNNTDNDMIQQGDGTYMLVKTGCELYVGSSLEFKVAANHDWGESWPSSNYIVHVNESGLYNITFTFNPTIQEVGCSLVKQGDLPEGDLPNLHIVSLNCSDPVAGQQMTVQWKVRNDGTAETGDKQWKDYIWLVPSISEGSSMFGTKLLKTVDNLSALGPGESYTNTLDVQLEEQLHLIPDDEVGVAVDVVLPDNAVALDLCGDCPRKGAAKRGKAMCKRYSRNCENAV